ncbi:MAG: phage tail terminator family protein [Cetobacterium sp.]
MIYKKDIEIAIIKLLKADFKNAEISTESIFQNLKGEHFFIDIIESSKTQLLNKHEIERDFLINIKYWNKKRNNREIYNHVSDIFMLNLFRNELEILPYLTDEDIIKEIPILREEKRVEIISEQDYSLIDDYLNFTFNISFTDFGTDKEYQYEILNDLDGEYLIDDKNK